MCVPIKMRSKLLLDANSTLRLHVVLVMRNDRTDADVKTVRQDTGLDSTSTTNRNASGLPPAGTETTETVCGGVQYAQPRT